MKVAINGFGRIGRLAFKCLLQKENVEVVAINDLTNNATLAHLLKYDSVQGRFNGTVESNDDFLIVNGKQIRATAERDPEKLPWGELGIDVVLESTGFFRDPIGAQKHITAGAKKVVISAPASGDIKTVVLGVNDHTMSGNETIVSNASFTRCTSLRFKKSKGCLGFNYTNKHRCRKGSWTGVTTPSWQIEWKLS